MRYSKKHKQETRARIIDAALQKFLTDGYYGIGIDGMAKAAGVTSGAFYGHFHSKSEAFKTVAVKGLTRVRNAIEQSRDNENNDWIDAFAQWYFSNPEQQKKNDGTLLPLQGGCALPSLSPEVARADKPTRKAYEQELLHILDAVVKGLPDHLNTKDKRCTAWAILSLMAGGVILARAVDDNKISSEISKAALLAINEIRSKNKNTVS